MVELSWPHVQPIMILFSLPIFYRLQDQRPSSLEFRWLKRIDIETPFLLKKREV